MRKHVRQQAAVGFTLVELLVVIGIIALLISVLMPALAKARSQAMITRCMANHKQIIQGVIMYTMQNRPGTLPAENITDSDGSSKWYARRYIGQYVMNTKDNTLNNSRVLLCPLYSQSPSSEGLGIGFNNCYDNGIRGYKYSTFRQPSRLIILGDVRVDSSGYMACFFEQLYFNDGSPRSWDGLPNGGSRRQFAYRHNKQTVVSFADGHVEAVKSKFGTPLFSQMNDGIHAKIKSGEMRYKARTNY